MFDGLELNSAGHGPPGPKLPVPAVQPHFLFLILLVDPIYVLRLENAMDFFICIIVTGLGKTQERVFF